MGFIYPGSVSATQPDTYAGKWQSYTPTLTGFTPGNGTWSASYCQIGKLVSLRVSFTFGTTSAGATANPTITLPVTASGGYPNFSITGRFFDASAGASYLAVGAPASTTTVALWIPGASGLWTTLTTTTPFTWTTSDQIIFSGVYDAAA